MVLLYNLTSFSKVLFWISSSLCCVCLARTLNNSIFPDLDFLPSEAMGPSFKKKKKKGNSREQSSSHSLYSLTRRGSSGLSSSKVLSG